MTPSLATEFWILGVILTGCISFVAGCALGAAAMEDLKMCKRLEEEGDSCHLTDL